MTRSLEDQTSELANIDWLVFGPLWLATIVALLMAEYALAHSGTWSRKAAQTVCYPLHWIIAGGAFLLGLTITYKLEEGEGFAIGLVLSFLGFLGTLSLLEHVHEWIWKVARR